MTDTGMGGKSVLLDRLTSVFPWIPPADRCPGTLKTLRDGTQYCILRPVCADSLSMIRLHIGAVDRVVGFAGYLSMLLSLIGALMRLLYERSADRLWLTSLQSDWWFSRSFLRQFYSIRRSELKADQPSSPGIRRMLSWSCSMNSAETLLNDGWKSTHAASRNLHAGQNSSLSECNHRPSTTIVAVPAILSGRFPERELLRSHQTFPATCFRRFNRRTI